MWSVSTRKVFLGIGRVGGEAGAVRVAILDVPLE